MAPGCAEEVSGARRVCDRHWRALPGRWRSKLSLAIRFKRTDRTDRAWSEAVATLGGQS